MDMLSVILLVLLVVGFFVGWRDISKGSGLASRLPGKFYTWINKKDWKSILVKIIFSLVLAYVYMGYKLIMALLYFIDVIFHL